MRNLIYIALLLVVLGCNPDGAGCFQSAGTNETIDVIPEPFHSIELNDNIDLIITPAQSTECTITAGSNLLEGIKLEVVDSVLRISNNNTCSFMRRYANPIIRLSITDLQALTHHGFGTVISTDTLNYDDISIISEDGSGDIRLYIESNSIYVVSNNVAEIYLSGYTEKLRVGIYWSDGIFRGENLITKTVSFNHSGSNNMHLNVTDKLEGVIRNFGDVVLHKQMPMQVDVEVSENSQGKVRFNGD